MKERALRPKSIPKTPPLPPSVPMRDLSEALNVINSDPPAFWDHVEGVWDWSELRRSGRLDQRIKALDRHFFARSKTHKVCPIVLLLNNGPNE